MGRVGGGGVNDGVLKEKARFVGAKRDVTHGENGGGCGREEYIFFWGLLGDDATREPEGDHEGAGGEACP